MMRRERTGRDGGMRHGLISLLTVVVVISLATAAVLTVTTSHAMWVLAQRNASMTSAGYDAERCAQSMLARIDNELAASAKDGETPAATLERIKNRMGSLLAEVCEQGVTATYALDGNVLTCTFVTKEGRSLETSLVIGDDATYDITGWRLLSVPEGEDAGDTPWSGSAAGD